MAQKRCTQRILGPANLIPSKGDEYEAATTVIKSIHDVSACSEMLQEPAIHHLWLVQTFFSCFTQNIDYPFHNLHF